MNINCVICSDLISQTEDIYFTKCGHVFHYHCLTQWIERSKSCPQCRRKVTEQCIHRVYFNFASSEGIVEDAAALQAKLDNANFQLRQKETVTKEKDGLIKSLEDKLTHNEEIIKASEKKLVSKMTAINALKEQLDYIKIQNRETERLRAENEELKIKLSLLKELQKVSDATASEVDSMLDGYTDVKHLASFVSLLKRGLQAEEKKNKECRDKMLVMRNQISDAKVTILELQTRERQLEERLSVVTNKFKSQQQKRKAQEEPPASAECDEFQPAKMRRSNDSSIEVNVTIETPPPQSAKSNSSLHNMSVNSLVDRIEQSDSPYLNLKQGSAVVTSLHQPKSTLASSVKPSEFQILQPSRGASSFFRRPASFSGTSKSLSRPNKGFSIFNNKNLNQSVDLFDDIDKESARLETSYDGLGGHSKPDVFPVPLKRSPIKSCVPKLSAKHKLKRPNVPNNTDIAKLLEKMNQNNKLF